MKPNAVDSPPTDRAISTLDALLAGGLVLFLLGLPFHLVIKRLLPGPAGTYWKEALLILLVALWAVRCFRARRLLLSDTPLDWAVLSYVGLLVLRFITDGPGRVTAWGLYVSAMYVPLFWLVPTALRRDPSRAVGLIALLVGVGGIVALGGLVEFALDVPLWPSDEIGLRQGFSDMFIYGTHVRRVYFTFDSPTTLANTLALLLPLALALVHLARRAWMRLAAGVLAVLMVGCIVVTFSRGIWVATLLSLLVMGVVSGLVQRNRRVLLIVVAALIVVGAAWGIAVASGSGRSTVDLDYGGVVELSPAAYGAVPVTGPAYELLQVEPTRGESTTQVWTLADPITGQTDERVVLYEHPPDSGAEEIVYRVTVPEGGALRFAIALSPDVWSSEKGDGVSFQVYLTDPNEQQDSRFVFVRYVNPKHNLSDRRWRSFVVDLSPWAGRTVGLTLITESGPAGDPLFDWAGWAEPQVVALEATYFDGVQTENAVLRHTGSILDWTRDETNRDRLAAWSSGLNAWRAAPLWGNGLGTTGVAALRTNPDGALVTESQVLKALVELGLPGVLVLGLLWVQTARVGVRALRDARDPLRRALLLAILASLLVVFIESWVYQNLEAKQVNAYFWALTGALALLAGKKDE